MSLGKQKIDVILLQVSKELKADSNWYSEDQIYQITFFSIPDLYFLVNYFWQSYKCRFLFNNIEITRPLNYLMDRQDDLKIAAERLYVPNGIVSNFPFPYFVKLLEKTSQR